MVLPDWSPTEARSVEDPVAVDRQLRQHCPVAYSTDFGGFWSLFRHEDIVAAARDTETFISAPAPSVPWDPKISTPWVPLQSDPPLHRFFRQVVSPFFANSRLSSFEPRLEELAHQLVDEFADRDEVEFVSAFAIPLPAMAICFLMGLPESHWETLSRWTHTTMVGLAENNIGDVKRVRAEAVAYCEEWMQHRRSHPGDDVMSAMLAADIDGRPMTNKEIHGMWMLLSEAGHETTSNAISGSVHHLAQHDEHRRHLAQHPEQIPDVIEELVRYTAPTRGLARTTTREVQIGGRTIPAGERVTLMFSSGCRDEDVYDAPDECDFSREAGNHVAFGVGMHRCLGERLARREMRISLKVLLQRLPEFSIAQASSPAVWPMRGYQSLPLRINAR